LYGATAPQRREEEAGMISFTVNGRKQQVDALPEMPLLWVIRDTLNNSPIRDRPKYRFRY